MKLCFSFCFLLIIHSTLNAQLFIDEELRTIHGLDKTLASKNKIHFQTCFKLLEHRNGTDTSLLWNKEYNQKGLLVLYFWPSTNLKGGQYDRRYDTLDRLSYESYISDGVLYYKKSYSYWHNDDTLLVELVKSVGKPVYTTKYYYCPSNKLIYKTGVDTAGQKQRIDYIYYDDGLLKEVISTAYGGCVKLIEYQYDSLGNQGRTTYYYWTGKIDYIEYKKYENNNCIELNQIDYFLNKSQYKAVNTYDNNNNLVEQIVYTYDKFFSHTKYYYNSENLIIRQELYDRKNRLENTTVYTYETW